MKPVHVLYLLTAALSVCSWVQMLEKEGKIAKFIPVDFSDAETVFHKCMQVGPHISLCL